MQSVSPMVGGQALGGDVDTNCAIVGGIVALSVGWEKIPKEWLKQMEPLPPPCRPSP